jgi:Uma2 family endonuclease
MGKAEMKAKQKYTYAQYRSWPEDERWEIIDGEAYAMTPAPNLRHQTVVMNLTGHFFNFFKNKQCKPFVAPTDVVLDAFNIVQPDLLVVCDRDKMTNANIQGAPDLVVEVLSPSTNLKDRREKKALYERFGVREYLLVYSDDALVERYSLTEGKYAAPDILNWDERIRSTSFPELEIDLWEIFEKELPQEKDQPDSSR